ncbi:methylated-DNA--[protein]-cysteine S-methyltransferase [Ichthyenterobacterium sp. W332]|uniref:Methylated-DNA--protein-cysteine methyltransferase n=1 Tax=Microcosmobacter mediterraneus TaxID=3075607 RepID=A0ABU2YI95_9FLAO|nr:methylated-DNA--[protein]-cysteine S-methyltransferase [Ichthyenterobacterium sp. W332]MDT0557900.1 methylated-DNA--[protein]-cysteine S-methyltransferase [Ichthyenterobacterium sp. W332]
MQYCYFDTPLGIAKIEGNSEGISKISILESVAETNKAIPNNLQDCVDQLKEYFKGKRKQFNLKLNPEGTVFQKQVWQAINSIPYGKTISYLDLSKQLGNVKAIRAVANANGKNPLWIVVPCHRVIGSDGSLTGYAGGLYRKKWLLEHENPIKQQKLFN